MFNSLDARRKGLAVILRQVTKFYIGYNADQGGGQPFQVNGGAFFNGALSATSLGTSGGATIGGNAGIAGSATVGGSLGVTGSINGIKTVFNGTAVYPGGTDTGVTAQGISQASGVMLIAYVSAQNGAGDLTYAATYMLRFPESGSAVTATRIALDPGSTSAGDFTFSVNGLGHLVVIPSFNANNLVVIQQMTG